MAEAAELQQLPLKLANFSTQLGYSYSNYDRTLAHAQFSTFQKDSNTNDASNQESRVSQKEHEFGK